MDNIREDNSGFSILEVLIAVMVLAIIIVPMFHSFVSSHRMNAKSKQIMRATTLAQNEMEIFEKEKIEDLLDPAKFSYTVTGPEADGSYVFERDNITNDDSGASASRYDVVVKLNPERENNTSRYYNANTKDLLYINTVGELDAGSFVQPIRNASNFNGYDENVYGWFYSNKLSAGATPGDYISALTRNTLGNGLARKITVRVYQVNEGSKTNTIVSVNYEYFAPAEVMTAGCQRYTDERIIYNNSQKTDEDGNQVELQNVFLFFAPRYDAKGIPEIGDTIDYMGRNYKVAEDLIVIENEESLPVNFYLVRQDILEDGSDTAVRAVPMAYQPKIEIYDSRNAEGELCGTYYTNLNLDGTVGAGTGSHTRLSIYDNNTGAPMYGGSAGVEYVAIGEPVRNSIRSLTGDNAKEQKDRIYSMEVKVYQHDDSNSIVTLTGTKLE